MIRGPLSQDERPLVLNDKHGKVAFTALPYGNEFAARECFDTQEIGSPSDVLAAQLDSARGYLPGKATGKEPLIRVSDN